MVFSTEVMLLLTVCLNDSVHLKIELHVFKIANFLPSEFLLPKQTLPVSR